MNRADGAVEGADKATRMIVAGWFGFRGYTAVLPLIVANPPANDLRLALACL